MKRFWHLFLAPVALLFQGLVPGFIYVMSRAAFAKPPFMAENTAWTLSMTLLAALAVTGMALGCAAMYLLLTRSRRMVAVPMVAVFCIPAVVLASLYLHAVLVFLTWI